MTNPGSLRRLFLVSLAVLGLSACSGSRTTSIGTLYRQALLGQDEDLLLDPVNRANAPSDRVVNPSGADRMDRCRALIGRRFSGPEERATRRLFGACLGRELPGSLLSGQGTRLDERPREAGLVYFRRTRDLDGDGRVDDGVTKVGLVLGVAADGRVTFLHLLGSRARLGWLNLAQPNRRRLDGDRIENSFLGTIRPGDHPLTPYLAGQLLAGFASL